MEKELQLMDMKSLSEAAECLKIIAHPMRLRMIQILQQGKFTVGELAELCEIKSHVASEHLRLMQRCRLLDSEKEGRCVHYFIAEPQLHKFMTCIEEKFG